jgi:hypothetical protein
MVSYVIKESQFSVRTQDSTVAYANAKSGIEWANYYVEINPPESRASRQFDFDNDGADDLIVTIDPETFYECEAKFCVSSTGVKGLVTRKLEYEIDNSLPRLILNTSPPLDDNISISSIPVGTNTESFEFSFYFWGSHSMRFGLRSNASTHLAMEIKKPADATTRVDNVYLSAYGKDSADGVFKEKNQPLLTPAGSPLELRNDPNRLRPYEYFVKIRYIKNTAAKMILYRRIVNLDGSVSFDCLGSATLNLEGINLADLSVLLYVDDPEGAYSSTDATEIIYRKDYFPICDSGFANIGDGSSLFMKRITYTCPWMLFDNLGIQK